MKSATERVAPYQDICLESRSRIIQHVQSGLRPTLALLAHPTGGWNFEAPSQDEGYHLADDEDVGMSEEQDL